jgi:hypothetical protein
MSTEWKYERSILSNNVIQHIEYYKTCKPSIYNKEIRENLINEEICKEQNVPSLSSISKSIRNDLGYSFKKLSCLPVEKERHHAKQDQYIETMMDINPINVHFFDECSVYKTTGNRTRGHSEIGKPAFEVQRYSSNATYTVNLLVGYFGIYCYDIIEGPSNGLCLLEFFNHAIHARDKENNPVLAPNDVVVMDNCGFHHAALVEPLLLLMECRLFSNLRIPQNVMCVNCVSTTSRLFLEETKSIPQIILNLR